MRTSQILYRGMFGTILMMILIGPLTPGVYGASYLSVGNFAVADPVLGKDEGFGQCRLFTGPHGDFLDAGEVLMVISDSRVQDGVDFEISGAPPTYKNTGLVHSLLSLLLPGSQNKKKTPQDLDDLLDRDRSFHFRPDKSDLQKDVEAFLAKRGREFAKVRIKWALASLNSEGEDGDEDITCRFRVLAEVYEDNVRQPGLLKISYEGEGRRFTDFHGLFQTDEALLLSSPQSAVGGGAVPTSALAQNHCPIPRLTEGQWTGNSQIPTNCPTADCLVPFGGYLWWTNYHYRGDDQWHSFYFDNGQPWSPRNVSVAGDGLHLKVAQDDLGGGSQWAASEAVAMFKDDGMRTPASLGYGRYLVSVKIASGSPSFRELDTNVAFGAFTYQKDESGNQKNPYRELDLVEISRWGAPPCEVLLDKNRLCTGHAQHTLQVWDAHPDNLHRFELDANVKEVTLVMEWLGANQPVTFKQYNGLLPNLGAADAATPSRTWTTSGGSDPKAGQNPWVPASDCQRFHLNLWMGNFQFDKPGKDRGVHPPPVSRVTQEVVVTNFQYEP